MGVFAPDVLPDWAPLVFFALGAVLFMFGSVAAGWHFLRDEDAVGPSMPFRDVVRRAALRTEWGLSYTVREQSWPTWQEDLKREVLHKLAGQPPQAHGIRNARGEPEDSAPTLIPDWFWAKADFFPEHMLADNETGMIWQKGEPCPLLYVDVTIRRADVDELWPAVPKRRRAGRVSAFAELAREWHDTQEDARLNRNPGAGFDVAWNERAKLDDLSHASAAPPPADENFGERVIRAIVDGVNARPGVGSDIWDRIDDKEQQARAYQAQLAAGRAAIKVKAQLMRDRLATRNHSYSSPEYDTPSTASYLAAMWDAEERGHIYDEYHRSSFTLGIGKGAPRVDGDTITEVQRNVMALKEKRRKAGRAFQDKRRDLIASGRDLAHRFREDKPIEHWENWVRKQRAYMDIQPHLGDEYQAWVIRNARTVHLTNDGSSYPEAMFLRELARLEKEWGLV
ncbi:MAG TPA: hypothetical protein VFP12_11035 [Allosphingosinicella sp.]|nr:hypothetical protein [Allosphingosinicella sp.]